MLCFLLKLCESYLLGCGALPCAKHRPLLGTSAVGGVGGVVFSALAAQGLRESFSCATEH